MTPTGLSFVLHILKIIVIRVNLRSTQYCCRKLLVGYLSHQNATKITEFMRMPKARNVIDLNFNCKSLEKKKIFLGVYCGTPYI